MSDLDPSVFSIRETVEKFFPHKVKYFSELSDEDIGFITRPGYISHAINQTHLLTHVTRGRIQSFGDSLTKKFLRVHVTDLSGETLFISTKYPGMRSNTLNAGVVLTEDAVRKSSLPGIKTDQLLDILHPLIEYQTNNKDIYWNTEQLPNAVTSGMLGRLRKYGFEIFLEQAKDSSAVGRLFATSLRYRIAHEGLDPQLDLHIDPYLGGLLSQLHNNMIVPFYPDFQNDIQLIILNT